MHLKNDPWLVTIPIAGWYGSVGTTTTLRSLVLVVALDKKKRYAYFAWGSDMYITIGGEQNYIVTLVIYI